MPRWKKLEPREWFKLEYAIGHTIRLSGDAGSICGRIQLVERDSHGKFRITFEGASGIRDFKDVTIEELVE